LKPVEVVDVGPGNTEAPDEVTPIPALFWWSLFVPTFAVVVFAMQRILARGAPRG
jgi:hypothetical protein